MRGKSLAINGIIAALYVAVSLLIAPLAFSSIQFWIRNINHLVVFNRIFRRCGWRFRCQFIFATWYD